MASSGAPRQPITRLGVMLAEPRPQATVADGWVYELKYDGYRALGQVQEGRVRLIYRSGREATPLYPELVEALAGLPVASATVDGEICVVDPSGRTDFGLMQQRGQLQNPEDVRRMAAQLPVTYFAFDLLELDGYDLRGLPLLRRKELLQALLPEAGLLRFSGHIERDGQALFDECARRGLEGVVGKRAQSTYRAGRWPDWIKVTTRHFTDFAVVGYSEPEGSRSGFGALHLALRDGVRWVYAGKVGTGFSERELGQVLERLRPLSRPKPCCEGPEVPRGRGNRWVEPKLVVEVRYKEWPEGGLIRAAAFQRLRDDKAAEECTVQASSAGEAPEATNRDKVFWPAEGITKGELVDYYQAVSRWILPYLRDRPVMLTRFPDGIHGKSFFQNNVPAHAPDWVRRELMWNEERTARVQHFVCDDERTLVYLANLGTIPLHLWSARVADLDHPDWCILDLDPKTAPFGDVVTLAIAIRKLCEELELPSYPKTSGGSGLHVLIPLGGQLDHQQATVFAELLARVIAGRHPKLASVERAVIDRKGKVYVDFLQNGFGRLLAAPFCVRPVPGARVSAPLRWREVNAKLDPAKFTLRTILKRMEKLGEDPLAPVLTEKANVPVALERLAKLI